MAAPDAAPVQSMPAPTRPHLTPLTVVLSALIIALAVGCGATPERAPPRVSIADIEPLGIDLFEQRYVVTLRIENAHDDALRVKGMSYLIRLNGEEFGRGESADPFVVPAYGGRVVQLIVVSDLMRLLEQLRTLAREPNPRLRYGIEGDLSLEGAPAKMPYVFEDELSLPRRSPRPPMEAI